ncbi:UDP-GlcNAc:betaGal beta-1,3-N-acetylglucosaminyltransferase 7 isoform X2 [Hemibagrus wyckioides]|uniref:UDP-GlcNAc:betaGal beta-1,3-N-acetylglucosaminyltransferase 7 isoform X2 n=1 Tax=Hemibagrus wyckioides TaxID=337641 RepID=UPI00266CEC0A|nr:UDP-GlcNAc:betaGal beta-1,3-N-acetylglucosaminyltransferase 7 isoform X2 [Hemibagrus wyckioides]
MFEFINSLNMFRWRTYKAIVLMVLVAVLMVSVFQRGLVSSGGDIQIERNARMQRETINYWKAKPDNSAETTVAPVYERDIVRTWDITSTNCSINKNVTSTEGFKTLGQNFQQFLLYRHCRYFPMIMNHPEKCSGEVHLLLVIKSIISQHDRREVIRQTWGKEQVIDGKKIKLLFLLGTSTNEVEKANHQKLLEYEDYIYGDILQWDFMDTFFNLTLKETHFLKWFSIYCGNVQYIFKGDDDVFVGVTNILEYLESSKNTKDLFAGDVLFKARPIRKKENKYYIPPTLYNKTQYPPYAGGGGFLMDGPLARRLYVTSETLELFPIDDVFLGMCLEVLKVTPIRHNAFKTFGLLKDKKSKLNNEPCFFKSMIVVHKLLPPKLLEMWRLVHSNLVCTVNHGLMWEVAKDQQQQL